MMRKAVRELRPLQSQRDTGKFDATTENEINEIFVLSLWLLVGVSLSSSTLSHIDFFFFCDSVFKHG